jgi:hypothetical protein
MDEHERDHRKEKLVEEIRAKQEEMGHEGPVPAFLSILTDKVVDDEAKFIEYDERLAQYEERIKALEERPEPHPGTAFIGG